MAAMIKGLSSMEEFSALGDRPAGSGLVLIAMAAMPGSGKSTVALALGKRLGVPVLDNDVILTGLLDAGEMMGKQPRSGI